LQGSRSIKQLTPVDKENIIKIYLKGIAKRIPEKIQQLFSSFNKNKKVSDNEF
jgi:hypothetical protein